MKKIAIILVMIMTVSFTYAQNSKRTSAFNYLRYGKLDKAKTAIDEACVHEKTMNDAKTWFYKGNIYLEIANSTDEKYKDLDPDAFNVAYEAYKKAKELDTKNEYLIEITPRIMACAAGFYNNGVKNYNEKLFIEAANDFKSAYDANKFMGTIDTSALYNVAVAADLGEDNEFAKKTYNELIKLNYNNPSMYVSLTDIYRAEKDSIKALEIIQIGRERFPDEFSLIISETNLYLAAGETEKALRNLKLAIEKDTMNSTIYSAVGNMYDRIVADTTKTYEERMEAFKESEKAYKRAIYLYESNIKDKISNNLYDITYSNASEGTEQKSKINGTWYLEFNANEGTNVYLSNQVVDGEIAISSIYFDNKLFKTAKSEGNNVIASVSGILSKSGKVKYTIMEPIGFFDAVYNLGALYFNEGVNVLLEADALRFGDPKYDEEKAKGDKYLEESLPYLEKALEINSTDYNTLFSLKQIYSRTGQTEKYNEVNEKLKEK